MLSFSLNVHSYVFWLMLVSAFCFVLERVRPWRRQQKAFRKQIGQDFFWLAWNGHFAGVLVAYVADWPLGLIYGALAARGVAAPSSLRLLAGTPLWLQFVIVLVLKDIIDFCGHNVLHRVGWLWQFHKVHHSIEELDWIGNFRFHFMEVVFYRGLTYLPLVVLGADARMVLAVAVIGTLIGHLNHANLRLDWGPLRYVFNSPRFHVWHHDLIPHGGHGQNFAIIFSVWDWLFGTAYLPEAAEQPARLGFDDMDRFPGGLPGRFLWPLTRRARPSGCPPAPPPRRR